MPDGLTLAEWDAEFEARCAAVRSQYRARYGRSEPRTYLYPPSHWADQGDRRLARLRYDPDPASLGLCSLIESQTERLHARAADGARVVAAMKDLSVVPVFLAGLDDVVCFYADMAYMQPCTSEDPRFLTLATERGLDDTFCDVRAVVGALADGDYWPRPDLCVGAVGACCDDFSACMQHVAAMGFCTHFWEVPHVGEGYAPRDLRFVAAELARVREALEAAAGQRISDDQLGESIRQVNALRGHARRIRDLAYRRDAAPLPALECLLVEAIPSDFASDLDAARELLARVEALCVDRVERGEHAVDPDAVRLMMVTPSMDLTLQNVLEDLGARVTGTEYMMGHAYREIDESRPPLEALAENTLQNPMIGSAARRARLIGDEAARRGAEGVVLVSFFGASHCAFEGRIIEHEVRTRLGLPTVVLNCQTVTHALPEALRNRLEAFVETVRGRRVRAAAPGLDPADGGPPRLEATVVSADGCGGAGHGRRTEPGVAPDIFARLEHGLEDEAEMARREKARGRKVVGIYCEYSPREVILAAGAWPACLCGFSPDTLPAAEADLPGNLCPLIKSSYGYVITEACPFFELSDAVIAETTCDGKKKMYELIRTRRPMYVLELTQKPGDEGAYRHWRAEVENLRRFLERTLAVSITDDALGEAIQSMNRRRARLLALHEFTRSDEVYLRGTERLLVNQRVACTPHEDRVLDEVFEELRRRRAEGRTVARPGAPRVLVTGVPIGPRVDKVIRLLEEAGAAVVVQESCTGVKPLVEAVEENGDPLDAIARAYFHLPCSCFTPNDGRFALLDRLAEEFRVDGVVDAVWLACHTYAVESLRVRRWARERGLGFLALQTDYAAADTGQLRTRIESFLEMIDA